MTAGPNEPIAIVGVACRFPGHANDPETYFEMLLEGRDAIREVPASRWDAAALYDQDPDVPGKSISRWGGFVDRAEYFDNALFGMSPHDAAALDPQQRLLLETTWEALERAGMAPRGLAGARAGVFVGLSASDYLFRRLQRLDRLGPEAALGATHVAPGRIAQIFGFRGPAMMVDTACSSALVALHLACASLRSGECELAVVGAANVIASPAAHVVFTRARLLARDGRCKSFGATADGYVRSEGCAVLVVERLEKALAERHPIAAVVLGSAVNQCGRGAGLSVPDVSAQAEVIGDALASAGLSPDKVGYVEAHGTGTPLGDALEARAFARALLDARRDPLFVSAVKPNVGHCEAAAGMASLVKAVGSLRAGVIPAIRGLTKINPEIVEQARLDFARTNIQWSQEAERRVAAVHAYSVVGTNAHILLGAAPAMSQRTGDGETATRPRHVLVLSARSNASLLDLAFRFEDFLAKHADADVVDVCHAASVGRTHLEHRIAVSGATTADLRAKLSTLVWGKKTTTRVGVSSSRPNLAVAFSGEGFDSRPALGELRATDPQIRSSVDACAEFLGDAASTDEGAEFLLHRALWVFWERLGLRPRIVLGEGVGEISAALAAGALTIAGACTLVRARARALSGLTAFALIVDGAEQDVRSIAKAAAGVRIAAILPGKVVLRGARTDIEAFHEQARRAGFPAVSIGQSSAAQSLLVDGRLEEFARAASDVPHASPYARLLSMQTCEPSPLKRPLDATRWTAHIRDTARISDTLHALGRSDVDTVLEIGAQPTLRSTGMIRAAHSTYVASICVGRGAWDELVEAVAKLYVRGFDMDWRALYAGTNRRPMVLPTYAFAWNRHWLEFDDAISEGPSSFPRPPGHHVENVTGPAPEDDELRARLESASPADGREHLSAWLRMRLARLLSCGADFDGSTPLRELGVDSLNGVGLLAVLDRQFRRRFPAVLLLERPTLDDLTSYLADEVVGAPASARSSPTQG